VRGSERGNECRRRRRIVVVWSTPQRTCHSPDALHPPPLLTIMKYSVGPSRFIHLGQFGRHNISRTRGLAQLDIARGGAEDLAGKWPSGLASV